ncbi:unnamed protein product [Oikopleura dioica]|uniref:Regulator of MON1-CCZ1 complex N-terminal domain-containing protein n=1 Tax=Oikopleura dioica TaxID=34765 RepID=E4Y8A8_OIKDI|nr:unnamed protein product [Oikopleura dioica]
MTESNLEEAFLELTTRSIKFGPASTANAVFYDEGRREILSVDSNGTITVTSHKAHVKAKQIRLEPTGQIYAIKLSDSGLVATQRSHMSLDVFFKDNTSGIADMSISPSVKQQIISYFWLKNDQLAIVTTKSLELIQISVNTSKAKTLSKEDIAVAWCKYSAESSVFVISTGQEISAYLYARDCYTKISKLEIPRVSSLKEKAVWIIQLYKTTYICHLIVQNDETRLILHHVKKNCVTEESFMILGSAKDSYTLNVVDNLVAIHNLQLKLTSVFDVRAIPSEHGPSITGSIVSIKGLAPMVPGKPVKSSIDTSHEGIYVPQISYFTPNIIVDVRDGKLWELELRLDKIGLLFENDELFFRFLLRRRFHKAVAFDILRSQIKKSEPVERICRIFDQIVTMKPEPTLSQSDILVHVFQPLLVEGLSREELSNMMLLFLRSLDKIGQTGHERLICFLIDCLPRIEIRRDSVVTRGVARESTFIYKL